MHSTPTNRLAYLALAAAGALWGTSFLFGKIALEEMGPAYLVLYRFVLASAVLIPFVPRIRPRISRRDVYLLLVGAFLMGPLMFLLQFEGLDRTTASSAALIVGTAPPLMAIGGFLLDGERPTSVAWIAVLISSIGVALLIGGPGAGRTFVGDLLVFISIVAAVVWTLLTRRVARRVGVVTATTILFGIGTLILLPFAIALEGPPPLALSSGAWMAIIALGFVCTAFTFWLWNWGLQHAQASQAGIFNNLEPLVGAFLGVVLLGEQLGRLAVLGGAMVIAAAFVVSLDRPKKMREKTPARV
ncbi:MAG: EamA family transporter [Rubricoccaceae bacterium]|nr:EamA family transporter [Rubricoccaceae bacterium]